MLGGREEVLVYVSGITGFTHYSFLTILQIDLEQKHDNFPLPKFNRKDLLQDLPRTARGFWLRNPPERCAHPSF